MPKAFSHTEADRRPVIYAGRVADQVGGADLPNDCIVLGEQDTLLYELTQVLNRANTLVFLDPLSFPLEAMTAEHWNIPIVVVLPSGFDAKALITTFGSALFERLGFFDHIVTPDSALWEELRRKYCWAEGQRIPGVGDRPPSEVATTVCALFEAKSTSTATHSYDQSEAGRYWHERMLATSVPHRAADCVDYDLRCNKTSHRVQAAALEPRFAAPQQKRGTRIPLDVLEVGTGAGRWASSFDLTKTRFFGIDAREDLLRIARINFPEGRFDLLGSELLFPYEDESFDLIFTATIMHRYPVPAKRTLVSEMWRVARPGGQLLFLEDFVFEKQQEQQAVHAMSVSEFESLILDVTAGQVVLEHAESLRYPGEDLRTGMAISLLRLGVPKT
jgi:ubiquinone/menaquinone biosynthesis C-methylase UbiE